MKSIATFALTFFGYIISVLANLNFHKGGLIFEDVFNLFLSILIFPYTQDYQFLYIFIEKPLYT